VTHRSCFLAELTSDEVGEHLRRSRRVLVPVGSTEQHGPHAPLCTDALLATEVCRRVAPRVDALVAPALSYGVSLEHEGFPGLVSLTANTMIALVADVCVALARAGFRSIAVVNGHYTNVVALRAGILEASDRFPPETFAYSLSYWDALAPEELDAYLGPAAGLHANIGETSAVMAVDERLVHLDRAVAEYPDFPGKPSRAALEGYFFSGRGTLYRATMSGTWGDPTGSSAERGRAYLEQIEVAVARFVAEAEELHSHFAGKRG
jgi:creatinine amidohydrolase